MFTQTWKKYLPVIVLLMKRAEKAEQVLDMNHTDFERATGGKRIKLSFSHLRVDNGRTKYEAKPTALTTDLTNVLQEDEKARSITRNQLFEFTMNSNFQLIIKNITAVNAPEMAVAT